MAYLPNSSVEFTGGCSCSAIRYNIKIPDLEERPEAPGCLPTPIDKLGNTVSTRFPFMAFDHCNSCRRASGAIVQLWLIMPFSWMSFTLQPRDAERNASYVKPFPATGATEYEAKEVIVPDQKVLDTTYLGIFESSSQVHRLFCSRCGTPLVYAFVGDRGPRWKLEPVLDVGAGTLDPGSFEQIKPDRHLWWEHGTDWVKKIMEEGDGGVLIRHPDGRPSLKIET